MHCVLGNQLDLITNLRENKSDHYVKLVFCCTISVKRGCLNSFIFTSTIRRAASSSLICGPPKRKANYRTRHLPRRLQLLSNFVANSTFSFDKVDDFTHTEPYYRIYHRTLNLANI